MADLHGGQRDDVSRPLDAADRAGSIVTDQVRSIIDAAQARAGEIERNAHDEAGEIEAAAYEGARRVLESANRLGNGILGAERELTLLLDQSSKEVDALHVRLDQVPSRARPEMPGHADVEGDATTLETSSLGQDADFRESNGDGVQAPDEPEPEPEAPAQPDEDRPADKGIGEARVLVEVTRARVRDKPDAELAETYDLALALVGRVADPGESVYWQAMLESVVMEAAARPAFGQPAEGEDVGGHRAQRRRIKELKPLLDARRQQVEAAAGRDGAP